MWASAIPNEAGQSTSSLFFGDKKNLINQPQTVSYFPSY
jgi:hypothetical protein